MTAAAKNDQPPGFYWRIGKDQHNRHFRQRHIEKQHNLYNKYPDIVEGLIILLNKYIVEGRSTPGIIQQNDSVDFDWEQIEFIKQAKRPML